MHGEVFARTVEQVANACTQHVLLILVVIVVGAVVVGNGIRCHSIPSRLYGDCTQSLEVVLQGALVVAFHIYKILTPEEIVVRVGRAEHRYSQLKVIVGTIVIAWRIVIVVTVVSPIGVDEVVGYGIVEP